MQAREALPYLPYAPQLQLWPAGALTEAVQEVRAQTAKKQRARTAQGKAQRTRSARASARAPCHRVCCCPAPLRARSALRARLTK